jgi:hypothetical protein
MSNEQEKFNCYCKKHPYNNQTFFNRPHWTRRHFFQELAGAGVTGIVPRRTPKPVEVVTRYPRRLSPPRTPPLT